MPHTRPWPLPPHDAAATLWHLTDTHVGLAGPWAADPSVSSDRAKLTQLADTLDSPVLSRVDGMLLTGDITDNGGASDEDGSTHDPWAVDWVDTLYPGLPRAVMPGNHDLRDREANPGGGARTSAAWEHVFGTPANGTVDIGDLRVIWFSADYHEDTGPWDIPSSRLTWLDAQIGATTRPVVLANHYPLAELDQQVGSGSNPTVTPQAGIADLIGSHTNVIGHVCGHRHYAGTALRSAAVLTVAGRKIAHLAGPSAGLTDVTTAAPYAEAARTPGWSTYVTVLDETRWQVRYRRHLSHIWDGLVELNVTAGTATRSKGL